jgi:hypothetical protein
MRKRTIISATITAIVALTAIAANMANAAKPEFKIAGAFPIKFTSFSGPGTLAKANNSNTIECTKDTNKGEILSTKKVDFTVDFEGCTIFGIVNAHSLGDPANTILVTATGELCYISKAANPPQVGLLITPTGTLHIEAAGALAEVLGQLIGQMTPVNKKTLSSELILKAAAAGKQEQLRCEGGAETHLATSENEGSFEASSEATTDKIGLLREEIEISA